MKSTVSCSRLGPLFSQQFEAQYPVVWRFTEFIVENLHLLSLQIFLNKTNFQKSGNGSVYEIISEVGLFLRIVVHYLQPFIGRKMKKKKNFA